MSILPKSRDPNIAVQQAFGKVLSSGSSDKLGSMTQLGPIPA